MDSYNWQKFSKKQKKQTNLLRHKQMFDSFVIMVHSEPFPFQVMVWLCPRLLRPLTWSLKPTFCLILTYSRLTTDGFFTPRSMFLVHLIRTQTPPAGFVLLTLPLLEKLLTPPSKQNRHKDMLAVTATGVHPSDQILGTELPQTLHPPQALALKNGAVPRQRTMLQPMMRQEICRQNQPVRPTQANMHRTS